MNYQTNTSKQHLEDQALCNLQVLLHPNQKQQKTFKAKMIQESTFKATGTTMLTRLRLSTKLDAFRNRKTDDVPLSDLLF